MTEDKKNNKELPRRMPPEDFFQEALNNFVKTKNNNKKLDKEFKKPIDNSIKSLSGFIPRCLHRKSEN